LAEVFISYARANEDVARRVARRRSPSAAAPSPGRWASNPLVAQVGG